MKEITTKDNEDIKGGTKVF